MRTSEVLRAAKALIDTHEKWCKGRERGRKCISDALIMVEIVCGINANQAAGAFCVAAGIDWTAAKCIPNWNDAPERTHSDVMLAFATAIEYEEAREAAADEAAAPKPLPVPTGTVSKPGDWEGTPE